MTFITLICVALAVISVLVRIVIWLIHRKKLHDMRGFKGIIEIEQDGTIL